MCIFTTFACCFKSRHVPAFVVYGLFFHRFSLTRYSFFSRLLCKKQLILKIYHSFYSKRWVFPNNNNSKGSSSNKKEEDDSTANSWMHKSSTMSAVFWCIYSAYEDICAISTDATHDTIVKWACGKSVYAYEINWPFYAIRYTICKCTFFSIHIFQHTTHLFLNTPSVHTSRAIFVPSKRSASFFLNIFPREMQNLHVWGFKRNLGILPVYWAYLFWC